jgi:plastocyanin
MPVRQRVLALAVLLVALDLPAARAQSVLQRTPNLSGGWPATHGTLYFNFLHRFIVGEAPTRKVSNVPTFLLGAGLPGGILLGANYSTNSDVADSYPNEWEFFARAVPLQEFRGFPLDVSLQVDYNNAAESVDGELELARQIGRLRLMGVARGMSDAYGSDRARAAVGGGALLRLTRTISIGGDYVKLLNAEEGVEEEPAWSAALQLAIPLTPHTLSLQVANTTTSTLQGSSRGSDTRRYGFEFTIPITLARYFGKRSETANAAEAAASKASDGAPTTNSRMRNMQFEPRRVRIAVGSTLAWRNDDQVVHTVKALDGSWESPAIEPGGVYRHTFSQPGEFEITCGPHPFMKQTVEVK